MDTPPDRPVHVSDDGSVISALTDSEQWDLHCDADGTDWQGRSILNSSIGGSELGTPSTSAGSRRTWTSKGGAGIGCDAPSPRPHALFRARCCEVAAAGGGGGTATAAVGGLSVEEDDDNEELLPDAQLALALRAVYARHRHDPTLTRRTLTQKTETELGGADLSTRRRVIRATIALIKLEEAKAEAARGRHADIAPIKFTKAKAEAARGRHADDKPTACDDFAVDATTGLGVPGDGVRETGGARTGSAIVERSRDGVSWDDAVADDDGVLDIELVVEEAVRQDSFVAPWHSGRASTAAATAAAGLRPALDDASATGRTYDDITKSPPPHLRCVVSPLFFSVTHPPMHRRATTAMFVADVPWLTRVRAVLFARLSLGGLYLMSERVPLDDCGQRGTRGLGERSSTPGQWESPSTSHTTAAQTICSVTDTRRPKQPAGAPKAVVQISVASARASWSWRHRLF